MRIDEAGRAVMLERGVRHCWYGDPDLIHEIAHRAGVCKGSHPLNRSASVVGALAKSPLFKRSGFIRHLGRNYPVYELRRRK